MNDRRLIEEDFPIREISAESVREKGIRQGNISTLHIWWARRPLVACRAAVLESLFRNPSSEDKRQELIDFIIKFCKWETSDEPKLIENARNLVTEMNGDKRPKVLDCFAGGGAIPLEALRVGCESYALELNPVAVVILLCTLVYPQKYGRPFEEIASDQRSLGLGKSRMNPNRLAHDVNRFGKWVFEEVQNEISAFYPLDSQRRVPLAYIWARSVTCPNPTCQCEVPLIRQLWLAKKPKRMIALHMVADKTNKRIVFDIVESNRALNFDPAKATMQSGSAECPICKSVIPRDYLKDQAISEKMRQRLIAVVCHSEEKGKEYRLPSKRDEEAFEKASRRLSTLLQTRTRARARARSLVERTRRLAEGDEIYEIVRRRLFEDLGDSDETKATANAFFDYYRRERESFPDYVTSQKYLEKLQRAYPFHPEFLDVLNERWASIPQFQRTRAVLRMLALIIGQLYKSDAGPLIQISSARLSFRDFRSEVLEQLDARQFDTVIESDIAGTGARAARIDEEGNVTYQREHIAEGVATAIFFYSFGGTGAQPYATLPNLSLAVLRPGLESAFIPDAVNSLRRPITGLFYLEAEGDHFRFTVTPNLNMILTEREAAVNAEDAEKVLLESIEKQIGDKLKPVLFPTEPRDVPDQPRLTLVVLGPDDTFGKKTRKATEEKMGEIAKGAATYRTYRNCLVFAAPEEGHKMREYARRLIALRDIERLYARSNRLSEAQKSQLEDMMKDGEKALTQSIWRAYRFVITPAAENKLEVFDMALQIQQGQKRISDSIWDALVDKERLAPKIGPTRLPSEDFGLWPKEAKAISTKMVRDAFLTFTNLPMIPSVDVLRDAIVEGVSNGNFGYANGSLESKKFHSIRIALMLDRDSIEFVDDVSLLKPDFAYELTGTIQSGPKKGESGPEIARPSGGQDTQGVRGPDVYESVNVSSDDLDWKKWAEFHDAVIQPLVNSGANLKVRVSVEGSSPDGISANTVDLAVKEGLVQYGINAKVEPKKKSQD